MSNIDNSITTRPFFKKKRFLIPSAIILLLLIMVACTSGSESDSAESVKVKSGSSQEQKPSKNDADPNLVGDWKIVNANDIVIGQEFGMYKSVNLKVVNEGDSNNSPWLEIRVTKGNDLLTVFDCLGDEVAPGQSQVIECVSLDDYKGQGNIEIVEFL